MKKYHVHTTLSAKHRDILDRYKEKYVTQQKALERALECLENDSKHAPGVSEDDRLLLNICKISGSTCLIDKGGLKVLMETVDLEQYKKYVTREKPMEYLMEYYHQKPLRECSLKEVVDAFIAIGKVSNVFDTLSYSDDGDRHTIKIYHSLGINTSKIFKILMESLFTTYGARTESRVSEKTFFIKIFKNR